MEPDDLDLDELCYLAGLAAKQRRKRENALPKIRQRAGQTRAEFFAARQAMERSLAWSRKVEDHLILLIADIDESVLRDHQAERLERITKAAA